MPRPTRIHLEGALYYAVSAAVESAALFKDSSDYETYLAFLQDTCGKVGVKLFAFVLLADEVRLCVEMTGPTTVSELMHAVNSKYTKAYVKRYGPMPHLFKRLKLTIVEKAPSLLRITGCLHTAPRRRGLVMDRLESYPWSSYAGYLAPPASRYEATRRGEVREVLQRLPHDAPGRTYEEFVASVPDTEWEAMEQALDQPVMGSAAFLAFVEQYRARHAPDPNPMPAPRPVPPRGAPSVVLTGVLAMALLSASAAVLYAKNLSTMKEALHALAHERSLQFFGAPDVQNDPATARLAAFELPMTLNGVQVDITLQPITPDAEQWVADDCLEFHEGQFTSRRSRRQGLGPTRYAILRRGPGSLEWETAQADASGTMVSWRGEWDGQTMRGVLSRRVPGAKPVTYSFVGIAASPQERDHAMKEI